MYQFIFAYYVTEIVSQLTKTYLVFSLQQYVAWPSEILVGETEPVPKSQESKNDQRNRVGEGLLIWKLFQAV